MSIRILCVVIGLCGFLDPALAVGETEFCVVGDTGTGSNQQKSVAQAMMQHGCQKIIHTGDVIYPDGANSANDPAWQSRFEKPYEDLLAKGAVFYVSLGNHDHGSLFFTSDESSKMASLRESALEVEQIYSDYSSTQPQFYFPARNYQFQMGEICWWAIDTQVFRSEDAAALRQSMADSKNCRWRMAFAHHPIISSGLHGRAKRRLRKRLTPILLDWIDIYFAGHDHNLADEGNLNKDGQYFRQIVSGAGAKLRPVGSCNKSCLMAESRLGFFKVSVNTQQVMIAAIDQNGEIFYRAEINQAKSQVDPDDRPKLVSKKL